jgi:hypothetical protein
MKFSVFALLTTSLGLGCLPQPEDFAPSDWFQLPEQGGTSKPGDKLSPPSSGFSARVSQVLTAESKALEGLGQDPGTPGSPKDPLPAYPKNWVPWHLGGILTDLGLSAQGIFGPVIMNGTANIQTFWQHSKPGPHPGTSAKSAQNRIHFLGFAPKSSLENQVEPAIQGALASGIIRPGSEQNFRSQVLAAAEEFRIFTGHLNQAVLEVKDVKSTSWPPGVYRLDVTFDGSGNATTLINVGASVVIRFDWEPAPSGPGALAVNLDKERKAWVESKVTPQTVHGLALQNANLLQDLEKFIQAVSSDISQTVASQSEPLQASGFEQTSIRIGLGYSVAGNIGVARGSQQAVASIEFDRPGAGILALSAGPTLDLPEAGETLRLMGDSNQERLAYAAKNGIAVDRPKQIGIFAEREKTGASDVVYQLDRDRFRKGLAKAMQIGSFFASKAATSEMGSWKVSQLMIEFDLSVGGTLGVVTVDGLGVVELDYNNLGF